MNCVPLKKYCELYGESESAVKKRIERGIWVEDLEVLKIDGVKERWIDLDAVSVWARGNRRSK